MATPTTTTVVVGAGPAGLAMSRHLTDLSIDHLVLERGRTAERWRSERWDSLRLLTPNWQTRLPGWAYRGGDPDGYMTMPEVIAHLAGFASSFDAPVREETTVISARPDPRRDGYVVVTDQGTLRCESLVVATGATGRPNVPRLAAHVPPSVHQVTPSTYRNPDSLAPGQVLVVGASASGVQLAEEIQRSGRQVTLAVGEHARLPRTYRGMDIQWWLDALGVLDRRFDEVRDLEAARRTPSMQLVGTPERRSLDLGVLARTGVGLAGRLVDVSGGTARFADDLPDTVVAAETRQSRVLDRIDRWVTARGRSGEFGPPTRPAPVAVTGAPRRVRLGGRGIATIVWATGYRPHDPWLHIPVTAPDGSIRHHGGVTRAPGVYVLGLPFLRRRKSTFLDGFGQDAADLSAHLAAHVGARPVAA